MAKFPGKTTLMEIALNGIKFGVVLALLIGPVFFTIIQVSIEKGFWHGVMVSIGVSASDSICVIICYFGLIELITNPQIRTGMAYAGGTILVLFGLYHLIVKSVKNTHEEYKQDKEQPFYRYFLKGFIINGLSPSVVMFWVGTVSLASIDFGYSKGSQFFNFFFALLCTVLFTDIIKAYLADKLRMLVTPRFLMITNIVLGSVLIILGIRLILAQN